MSATGDLMDAQDEGQTQSFQAQVLEVWPEASCVHLRLYRSFLVHSKQWPYGKIIGVGTTKDEAWQAAAANIANQKF